MKKEIQRRMRSFGRTRKWRQERRLQGSRDMKRMTCTVTKDEIQKKKEGIRNAERNSIKN